MIRIVRLKFTKEFQELFAASPFSTSRYEFEYFFPKEEGFEKGHRNLLNALGWACRALMLLWMLKVAIFVWIFDYTK